MEREKRDTNPSEREKGVPYQEKEMRSRQGSKDTRKVHMHPLPPMSEKEGNKKRKECKQKTATMILAGQCGRGSLPHSSCTVSEVAIARFEESKRIVGEIVAFRSCRMQRNG